MEILEDTLINQNKAKSYLISVEKATKQTRNMSEMGTSALNNVENIIKFLKVEKMYELVFQAEPPSSIQPIDQEKLPESMKDSKKKNVSLSPTELEIIAEKNSALDLNRNGTDLKSGRTENRVGVVQEMLDSLKTTLDLPVQFKPKSQLL
jgi:hypothetical protein